MRIVLLAGLLVLACAAGASSPAATGQSPEGRTAWLQDAKSDLTVALKDEDVALEAFDEGYDSDADTALHDSQKALKDLLDIADELTPAAALDKASPVPDPWASFDDWANAAYQDDGRALASKGDDFSDWAEQANAKKEKMLALVKQALGEPDCTELINLQGPVKVNGVAQGSSELTVAFHCREKIRDFIVDVPDEAIAKVMPAADESFTMKGSHTIVVKPKTATSGSVTMETNPDPSDGQPVQSLVVPIAGDSVQYYDEVM